MTSHPGLLSRHRRQRPVVDVWKPHGALVETERLPNGGRARVLTAFLSGRECPFECVFCDLWRYTIEGPTPPGALPAQLRRLLREHGQPEAEATYDEQHIKLYNASNYFDVKAVPKADDDAMVALLQPFDRVIVESHPKLVGRRCLEVAQQLGPDRLQVAMGLETVHPEAQPRLGKGADLDDYRRAAQRLRGEGIVWRAFVLVGAPFIPLAEAAHWAARSTAFAFENGAVQVSLIPVRGDHAALRELASQGDFQAPTLGHLEEALDRCLELDGPGLVSADLWDLASFSDCQVCFTARRHRLERIHLTARPEPPMTCSHCAGPISDAEPANHRPTITTARR